MQAKHRFILIVLTVLLSLSGAAAVSAAPFEFTPTARTAFDKMVAAADQTTARQLTGKYAELQALQKEEVAVDMRSSALRYKNEAADVDIRKRIREIDQSKIKTAEAAVAKAKENYAPLFALYETQKSQLSMAKSAKNKELTARMSSQVELTKIAVQIAKDDIKQKEASLKKIKADAADKTKRIRDILAANDGTKIKVKSARSTASQLNKLLTAESKLLVQSVRKLDADSTLGNLSRMITHQRKILIQKLNILYYEQQIQAVIHTANTQMKAL